MSIIKVHDRKFKPFISAEEIKKRIHLMADNITIDLEHNNPLFIVVLNGAFMFASDLYKGCQFESEITFVQLSSYQGTQSTQRIQEIIGLSTSVYQRHVIILEDIVDTGLSMFHLLNHLKALEPASIKIAALLLKPEALKYPVQVDYVGFEIGNEFVLGYGLDYNGQGRNLPFIYVEAN